MGNATASDEAQAPHPTSVAVWGAPSPVVAASQFAVTVGVKCAAACRLAGRPVVIRDEAGRDVGHGALGADPRAGTRALYAAAVTLTAPSEPGVHSWTAAFPASGVRDSVAAPGVAVAPMPHREAVSASKRAAPAASHEPPSATSEVASASREAKPAPSQEAASAARHEASVAGKPEAATARHEAAACTFSFRTVDPAGNAVIVTVVDRETAAPLVGAHAQLGVYRAATDAEGTARLAAPAGEYELYVRSPGYVPHTQPVVVTGDAVLRVAAVRASDHDLDDDQVWM